MDQHFDDKEPLMSARNIDFEGGSAAAADPPADPAPAAAETAERPKPEEADYCVCCCCGCQVHDPTSRENRCCCCFPLKCGIFTIVITIFFLFVLYFTLLMFQFYNIYFDTSYCVVCLFLLAALGVACAFAIAYLFNDSKGNRARLVTACILVMAWAGALCLWNIIYITGIYDQDDVYVGYGDNNADEKPDYDYFTGSGDSNYAKESRAQWVIESICTTIVIVATFFYFMTECSKYADTY